MFGFSLWKLVAVLAICAGVAGYFKYTQDQLAELNQQVATKDFALKTATATIEQQQKDMQRQQEVMSQLNGDFQASRARVNDLEGKFSQIDLDRRARDDAAKLEEKINNATKKVFRCLEDVINKGSKNAGAC
jgi:uncharacterized protein HemX